MFDPPYLVGESRGRNHRCRVCARDWVSVYLVAKAGSLNPMSVFLYAAMFRDGLSAVAASVQEALTC